MASPEIRISSLSSMFECVVGYVVVSLFVYLSVCLPMRESEVGVLYSQLTDYRGSWIDHGNWGWSSLEEGWMWMWLWM